MGRIEITVPMALPLGLARVNVALQDQSKPVRARDLRVLAKEQPEPVVGLCVVPDGDSCREMVHDRA